MKSDPADVLVAIWLSSATVRKMQQNLFWASIYNVTAIPVAAGVLYPSLGLLPRPEFSALAMSVSSITVVSNALLLRREAPRPGAPPEHIQPHAAGTEGPSLTGDRRGPGPGPPWRERRVPLADDARVSCHEVGLGHAAHAEGDGDRTSVA